MNQCNLNQILELAAKKERMACVFDLDSTLFNVSARTQKIIDEFAESHESRLKGVEILHTDWGLRESLFRAGFHANENPEMHTTLRDFWVERFFSNEYLHYDLPYEGAVSFVQRLAQTTCEIHYLTGRDVKRMGTGTREVLEKWGFPIKEHNVHLKPDRSLDDHTFKVDFMIQKFPQNQFDHIYFFENEPVNINALSAQRKDIHIVYLDTTHSRREDVQVPVSVIKNFTLPPPNTSAKT